MRRAEQLGRDCFDAEQQLRVASRELADAEAQAASALAAGKKAPSLHKHEARVSTARRAAKLLRQALGLARKADERTAEATTRHRQEEAREKVAELARATASHVRCARGRA